MHRYIDSRYCPNHYCLRRRDLSTGLRFLSLAPRRQLRIVANIHNLIFLADDFFRLGDAFKARMIVGYISDGVYKGVDISDAWLRYLNKLISPYHVILY